MKVALVYPRFRWFEYNGLAEPVGQLILVSVLRNAGHDIRFVDYSFCKEIDELDHMIRDVDIVAIAVSAAAKLGRAALVAKHLRTVNEKAKFVAGGAYPSIFPQNTLEEMDIDFVMEGEAEEPILEFVETMAGGGDPKVVRNLSYLENGAFVQNPRRPVIKDLDSIPYPARDVVDYDSYISGGMAEYGMVTSRGCPFKCTYCKPSTDFIFGGGIRLRGSGSVVGEIIGLSELRSTKSFSVFFKDDTITMHPTKWFEEFRDGLKQAGIKLRWHCNSRVDTVTRDKVRVMAESGCHCISFGIESGSPKILAYYQKGTTPEQAQKAFHWCHEFGVEATANLMIGFPMETNEDIELTYRLLRKLKPDDIIVYFSTAIPGRYIHEWAKANGYLANDTNPELLDPARNRANEIMNMRLPYLTLDEVVGWKHKIERYRSWRKMTSFRNVQNWAQDLVTHPGDAMKKAAKVVRGLTRGQASQDA
jgi:anaerobic magnesium-protoporphyrin IX monomethyl ester cyclase